MRKKKRPKISIAKIVQRGNDLAMICRHDKTELIKAGIEWNIVQRVAELVPLCSDADSLYQLQKESLCIATKEHLEYLKECSKLRGELRAEINTSLELCGFRKKLPGLSKKRSKTDLVQDLNDLR